MTNEIALPIDAHVIALNQTLDWNIRHEDKKYIDKINSVYFYNKNVVYHLCEFTQSYDLYFLYYEVVLNDKGNNLSDDKKEALCSSYEDEPCDDDNGKYYHCKDIDCLEGNKSNHYHYGATEVSYEDTPYEEQMESLREHFCCNHKL